MASSLNSYKRGKIRRYFGMFPTWAWWLLAIGPVAAAGSGVGLLNLPEGALRTDSRPLLVLGVVVGLISIGVGIMVFLNWPTDRQIDAWFADDLKYLRENGLVRLNLTEDDLVSDREVQVWGPYRPYSLQQSVDMESLFEIFVEVEQKYKKGKDGRVRYSIVHLSIIFLTKHHLSAYSCIWDFARGEVVWEKSDEFFYQDVVSVSTETLRTKIESSDEEKAKRKKEGKPEGEHFEERERFRLTTSAATGIKVSLPERRLVKQLGDFVTSNVEGNIRSIRKMLREKKMSSMDPIK